MAEQIPLVDYLVLGRRTRTSWPTSARTAARGSSTVATPAPTAAAPSSERVPVATTGEVRAFTIVSLRGAGIPVPFVAAVVDCDGTSVRANLINVEPDPEHVTLGMKVRLATYPIGTDNEGTEAIGFGFEPR